LVRRKRPPILTCDEGEGHFKKKVVIGGSRPGEREEGPRASGGCPVKNGCTPTHREKKKKKKKKTMKLTIKEGMNCPSPPGAHQERSTKHHRTAKRSSPPKEGGRTGAESRATPFPTLGPGKRLSLEFFWKPTTTTTKETNFGRGKGTSLAKGFVIGRGKGTGRRGWKRAQGGVVLETELLLLWRVN